MEEVVERYLENEKIVRDQVLLILDWHVFAKYWVVVTTPIHLLSGNGNSLAIFYGL